MPLPWSNFNDSEPDISVALPLEALPSADIVWVLFNGLAGLTAESPSEAIHCLYSFIFFAPFSALAGGVATEIGDYILSHFSLILVFKSY